MQVTLRKYRNGTVVITFNFFKERKKNNIFKKMHMILRQIHEVR